MAAGGVPWHGAEMRFRWLLPMLGLFACNSGPTAEPSRDAGPDVSDAGDGGDGGDGGDEGPIPPAPTEPGCSMTIDGVELPSRGGAVLGSYLGKSTLKLVCSDVDIEITEPSGPGVYQAVARYGNVPRPEYEGPCTARLDRLAIEERGGLAARVRCDVPLVRALNGGNPTPSLRIAGYVVLPPAGPFPKGDAGAPGPDRCTFSVSGAYTYEGSGNATNLGCGDGTFSLLVGVPAAVLHGTFCPNCSTWYDDGTCTRSNEISREHSEAFDIACDLGDRRSGRLRVNAHVDGQRIYIP